MGVKPPNPLGEPCSPIFFFVFIIMANSSPKKLKVASTSSIQDAGLLDVLGAEFKAWGGSELATSILGTGKALALGRRGEVDAVIVHDRGRELQFLEAGHGVNRREFMTNDFLLAGPPSDPAGVGRAETIHDALEAIYKKGIPFLSRADDSGTNLREIDLWANSTVIPFGKPWYGIAPGGMIRCLEAASEQGAYTLTDRGTFIAHASRLSLQPLCSDPRHLRNAYSVIAINPARHPEVNYEGAMSLVTFLTGPAGQQVVKNFNSGSPPLFHPVWEPPLKKTAKKGAASRKLAGKKNKDDDKGGRFGMVP